MFSHDERVKSTFFQRFCEYVWAYAFIGDDGGDPEFHLLPPAALEATTRMDDLLGSLAHVIESMPHCVACPRPVPHCAM
jgi:hypothetical protein